MWTAVTVVRWSWRPRLAWLFLTVAMSGDVMLGVDQCVVDQNIGVLPGGGTGLKIEVDDLRQRLADADHEVGRSGDGGQIDVEQDERPNRRTVEGDEEISRGIAAEILERGVEGHRHGEKSRGGAATISLYPEKGRDQPGRS